MKYRYSTNFFKDPLFYIAVAVGIVLIIANLNVSVSLPTSRAASVVFEFEGQKRAFEGEVMPSMSILDALLASTRAGSIDFKYTLSDQKLSINSLDSLRGADLGFYLNGERIDAQKLHLTYIGEGDRITVTFQ